MPITFTAGLTPTFAPNSFGSEKTHVKQLAIELLAGDAYKNPLASVLTTMIARVDAVKSLLATDKAVAVTEAATMNGYVTGTLPSGFSSAGYTDSDMTNIANAATAFSSAENTLQNQLTTFKNDFTVPDLDNFKLHNELLCGIDPAPPAGVIKPNLNGLMGLAMAITDTENRFGIVFTNYLTGLFGTLFTADTTIATAQTHLNTNPLPTTYDSLNILTTVNGSMSGTTPTALINAIGALSSPMGSYGLDLINTHKAAFTAHITTDMAYYNATVDKLEQYIQAYQVSGHIQDPYYKFMYDSVFGSATVIEIATKLTNGEIT